jgi:pimeloyl-ACP methyl ester carboxylesterase
MTGTEGLLLRQRLAAYGLSVETVRYGTTTASAGEVTAALARAIEERGPAVCLLGHSLGGLMILRCLAERPDLLVGNVLLLGSPVNGSRAARALARLPGARWCLGEAALQELLRLEPRAWTRSSALGIIAGDAPWGVGSMLTDLPSPHDGAVTVAETQMPGATAQRVFHVNHMGLLLSADVARAAATFLKSGCFPD